MHFWLNEFVHLQQLFTLYLAIIQNTKHVYHYNFKAIHIYRIHFHGQFFHICFMEEWLAWKSGWHGLSWHHRYHHRIMNKEVLCSLPTKTKVILYVHFVLLIPPLHLIWRSNQDKYIGCPKKRGITVAVSFWEIEEVFWYIYISASN